MSRKEAATRLGKPDTQRNLLEFVRDWLLSPDADIDTDTLVELGGAWLDDGCPGIPDPPEDIYHADVAREEALTRLGMASYVCDFCLTKYRHSGFLVITEDTEVFFRSLCSRDCAEFRALLSAADGECSSLRVIEAPDDPNDDTKDSLTP